MKLKLYDMAMPIFNMSAKDFFVNEIVKKLPKVAFDGAVRAAEVYLASGVIALVLRGAVVFAQARKIAKSVREYKKHVSAA